MNLKAPTNGTSPSKSPFRPCGTDRIWISPSTKAQTTVLLCRFLLTVCLAMALTLRWFPTAELGLERDLQSLPTMIVGVALLVLGVLYGCQGPRWSLRYRLLGIGPVPRQFYRRTHVRPGYEPVEAAFVATLAEGRETGLQFALFVRGELVVDLAGSIVETSSPTRRSVDHDDPLQLQFDSHIYSTMWSSSKVVTSILMAWLVDRGYLNYQAKIQTYWPEFTGGGKEHLTVEQLLKHQAGLHAPPPGVIRLEDVFPENIANGTVSRVFESMPCRFPPKWSNLLLYHGMTRGWLCNEIARRVDPQRRTLGVILRQEFAEPLGIQDECHLGLPPQLCHVETNPQMRDLDPVPHYLWVICNKLCQYLCIPCAVYWKFFLAHTAIVTYATLHWTEVKHFFNPRHLGKHEFAKQPDYKRGESPAANIQASARAMATLANAMATRREPIFRKDPNDTLLRKMSAHPETRYLMPMPPPLFTEGGCLPMSKVTFNNGGFCVMSRMDATNVQTHIPSVPGVPHSLGWFGFNGSVTAFHPHGDFAFCFQPLAFNDLDPVARLEKLSLAMMECGRKLHGPDFGRYPPPNGESQ